MNLVKWKTAIEKPKVTVSNFEELRCQYLMDIKAIVTMEEIPDDMGLNWDQTAIKYIPLSNWTVDKEGSKQVKVVGIDKKCQIKTAFVASLLGHFLPVQLLYEGKATKCHPAVEFPKGWRVTHTLYHWCNEETMIDYIESVIVPYMTQKRRQLGLDLKHTGLLMLDEFKGQTISRVLKLL